MERNLATGRNKRRVKNFLLFLICTVLAWLLSNLSDSYESRTVFALNYKNLPDSLILSNNVAKSIEAKVSTSGFQLLYFNFFRKHINVDLSELSFENAEYFLKEETLKRQMDNQLSQNVSLLDLDGEQWKVDVYQVSKKPLFVNPNIELKFTPNHLLEGKLKVVPDSILIKGPKDEIFTLSEVRTEPIILEEITEDFSVEAKIVFPKGLDNSIFSTNSVSISGKVAKFSEKVFQVTVQAVNFPEEYTVKMFPNTVSLICKASIEQLKQLGPENFEVVADYSLLGENSSNSAMLQISKKPEAIYGIRLEQRTINFVLERK